MSYQLIDGKATAAAIKQQIAEEVKNIIAAGGKRRLSRCRPRGT
jgi:methylenetetrahydrofolate dehydrogenase (NADP+)/methenyltetrahydrofolate cyclohydrolase